MESDDEKDQKKKLYKCNLCEKKFTRKKNRNTHQLSHTAKNFKCDKCDKEFQYPSQLAKHQKVHQGYVCEDCGHQTDTWSKLVKDCGKKFKFTAAKSIAENPFLPRIKHRKEFHGKKIRPCENLFECPHCKKMIKTKAALNTHIQMVHEHDSDEAGCYQCGQCGREYKYKQSLKQHYLTVHMGRLFHCEHCKKTFGTKATLKRHLANSKLPCSRAEKEKVEVTKVEKDLEEVVLTEMVSERGI